jgi:parallel beta-helix repeat protein
MKRAKRHFRAGDRRASRRRLRRERASLPERLESRALLALSVFETDNSWRVSAADPGVGWTESTFDDTAFVAASETGSVVVDGNSLKMIWSPAISDDIWLRKTISLEGRPATARLDALADDDMELFINGVRFVNDTNQSSTTVTAIDVTSALAAGTNVIAARVRNAGGDRGFAARLDIDTERADAGGTLATALSAGVVPGMHMGGVTLASSADVDLYRVELLRTDSLRATASLDKPGGSLSLTILDVNGQTVATATQSGTEMVANAASLPAGTYYLRVSGSVAQKSWYRVGVEAGTGSTTRVIYVNDGSSSQDVYALATGDDANDGLSPDRPKASVQGVLSSHQVDANTLIVIDTGDYGGAYGTPSYGTVAIAAADEGGTYAGSAAGSRFTYWGTRFELTDADLNTFYGLTFADSSGPSGVGILIKPSEVDASNGNVIRGNTFAGTSIGISLTGGSATTIAGNTFSIPTPTYNRYAAISAWGTAGLSELPNDLLRGELLPSWHLLPSLGLDHQRLSQKVVTFKGGRSPRGNQPQPARLLPAGDADVIFRRRVRLDGHGDHYLHDRRVAVGDDRDLKRRNN